ncbi:MAG TPA: hypothetical protein VIZ17_21235 [Acetobacteraceae bacterium]
MIVAGSVALAALLLLWPAMVNGYPLVFSDTGTYLSQAIHHYLGWDRPIFYSLFLLPLHMRLTTWPVVCVQALLAAHMLHLVRRTLRPEWPAWSVVPLAGLLAFASPLPFVAAELMPDLFTSLLVLCLALLIFVPDRLSGRERLWLLGLAVFTMTAHLSSLPLALALLGLLTPLRRSLGACVPLGRRGVVRLVAAPILAATAMIAVNVAGYRATSVAPFGNIFVLARVLYDGPGLRVLARDCPRAGWRLCEYVGMFPPTADDFLWRADSPLYQAGGAKLISNEADAIIAAAVRAEPVRELDAVLENGARQLALFSTGDGLQPWPVSVTPWIERDFPAFERAEYEQARQTEGRKILPDWMPAVHAAVGVTGLIVCLALLPGALRRRQPVAGFVLAMLLALLGNALITGGLSGPHDRYQSRLMWLPALIGVLALPPLAMRPLGGRSTAASWRERSTPSWPRLSRSSSSPSREEKAWMVCLHAGAARSSVGSAG